MGAGHDGAADEIARRLESAGHRATVVDLFDAAPRPLVWLWRGSYRAQLRWFPESYERTYALYYRPSRAWHWTLTALTALTGRRLVRWCRRRDADVVVSTYALGTSILGELRAAGRLEVPLVNMLTDFGVHPRTVHDAVDLHLAVHEVSATDARILVRAPVIATGPAVRPEFAASAARRSACRAALGFGEDDVVVLVATGSWGVGDDLEGTVSALAADGRFTVLVLCGRDEQLRARMSARPRVRATGWTDRMADHVAAADVVVENAGGLTAMESFAAGVPVVSYRPIPGHGRDNVRAMARAGVTSSPATAGELCDVVAELASDSPRRRAQLTAAAAMFTDDPARLVIEAARPDPDRRAGHTPA